MLKKSPLKDHLIEFKKRLIYSTIVYSIISFISYLYADSLIQILVKPLQKIDNTTVLIFTNLTEPFFYYIKFAMTSGFFISLPFLLLQAYLFLKPGLYKKEQRITALLLTSSLVLFWAGIIFVYIFIMPNAWQFLMSFAQESSFELKAQPKISEYIDICIKLFFAFGIAFELPVILVGLGKLNIIFAEDLMRARRYVIVAIFIFAAIMTPPDVISQIGLAIPMILLYEISILLTKKIEKKGK